MNKEETDLIIAEQNKSTEEILKAVAKIKSDYHKLVDSLEKEQKENAELKELLDCKNCCELDESECGSCAEFGHFRCKGKAQLTKAKVALRNVIDYLGQFCSDYPDCVIEAEQFLKDSEVEK